MGNNIFEDKLDEIIENNSEILNMNLFYCKIFKRSINHNYSNINIIQKNLM